MNPIYTIINEELVLKNDAKLSIADLSIQRGYGVFDYFRTVDNQPVFLEDHLDRFYYSASEMNLNVDLDRGQLKRLIQRLIEKNNIPDSGIRITLTGGYSDDGYLPAKPNLIITQTAFVFNKDNFDKGIRLITYQHQRQLPQVKTIDYLQAIRLQPFVKENSADDVLYHNQNEITECPRSNFFIVTENNKVVTPPNNILKGITRKKILHLSEFNIREAVVSLKDIENAKEAFITSTTKNVIPVLKIDGKIIGDGKPGKTTSEIYERLFHLKNEK